MPNGKHIDALRKTKALTIEGLALESDLGMRTVQKAIAGSPVSIETLQIIADTLKAPYESLLLGADAPKMLTLNIQIGISAADTQKISDIIEFLKKFLPDSAGLCVLAVAGGSVMIGVAKSQANESVLAGLELQEAMNTFGIERWSLNRKREPVMFGFLDSAHTVNYLSHARQKYDLHEHEKPWDELSECEEYDFYVKYLQLIADEFWNEHKQDFQGLLNEMQMSIQPTNFEALYDWCLDSLTNRLTTKNPRGGQQARFTLISMFLKYINYLDGSHKYEVLRNQRSSE